MSTHRQHRRRRTGRGWALAVLVAALTLLLGTLPAANANPGHGPTTITASVSSEISAPVGAPAEAVPNVLVQQGVSFQVTVTLTADEDPAWFTKATRLDLTATGAGDLSPSSVTMPARSSTATFAVSYSTFANSVQVSARPDEQRHGQELTAVPSGAFDVLRSLRTVASTLGTPFEAGAGDQDCASVDPSEPVCGLAVLPRGAASDVLLSLGACSGSTGCRDGSLVVQLIADLTTSSGTVYDRAHPATLIVKCDQSLCPQTGVPHFSLVASRSATGDLSVVPACEQKGVVNQGQEFCTDYRQSQRDGGDLLLYLLFVQDIRAGST